MASLWEILEPSSLRYDPVRGAQRGDSGQGPPSTNGWVRTGYDAAAYDTAGQSNCNAWSSNSASDYGTWAGLPIDWTSGQSIHVWKVGTLQCSIPIFRVWCVADGDLIFADDFESGGLAAWSLSQTGGGDLSATPGSALAGTGFGLNAVVNDTGALYVRDDTPDGERRYRARFYLDPSAFDPGEAQGHRRVRVFIAFDESPVKRHVAVVLRRVGGQYSVEGRVRVDDNSQVDTGFFPITTAPHSVEIDWRRATDVGFTDGVFQMWVDGVSIATLFNLGNGQRTVDFVRLGPQSLKGGAFGRLHFDQFESRRVFMIGP
jgi:hypothetical protein